jgi:hypothetical protein
VETVISDESVDMTSEVRKMPDVKRTASTKQVADALGVTPSTIQLYSRGNRIPFDVTPGGHRRYDIDEVRDTLDETTTTFLRPLDTAGLGAGAPVVRSRMAQMDSARRAVVGEAMAAAETPDDTAVSAAVVLIEHSRRVLVSV